MFTICFDTICTGYQAIQDENGPVQYETEQAAQAEIDSDLDFYGDCFVCPISEIGRKAIYHGTTIRN